MEKNIDMLASMAMIGLLASGEFRASAGDKKAIIRAAYDLADAMILEASTSEPIELGGPATATAPVTLPAPAIVPPAP